MNNKAQIELFHHINYMNMDELKIFCNDIGIPYKIHIETSTGKLKKTNDIDRKGIIIKRIKFYVKTGKINKPTVFPNAVVSLTNTLPIMLQSHHHVFYGEYKNLNKKILSFMKQLTSDEFEFGAIAQEVIRACWTKGIAPTYSEFATLWLTAKNSHNKPNPEWAFLTDRHNGKADSNWKKIRMEKANKAINLLNSFKH
ncbi:hypothetical protein BH10PSE19_BH10PSE19_22860 [soil metagenome]